MGDGEMSGRLKRRELLLRALPAGVLLAAAACSTESVTKPTAAAPAASAGTAPAAGASAAPGGLSAAAIAAAKSEGTAVGYGVLITSQWAALNATVKKQLGFSVENFRGNTATVLNRVITEKDGGKNLVDFVITDSVYLNDLRDGGYTQKLPTDIIERVPQKWRDPKGYWAIFTLFPMAVIYNTRLVSAADAPKSLQDVLDPKWKGKIALTSPVLNETALRWFFVLQQQMGQDKADQFFKALAAQKPTVFPSGLTVSTNLNEGQFSLGFGFMTHVLSVGGKNGHLGFMPTDPMPAGDGALAWATKPPHPSALKAVSEIFMSQEFLQTSGDLGYPMTVPGVKSAIPGADGLNYQPLPVLSKEQTGKLTAYFKGIFAS